MRALALTGLLLVAAASPPDELYAALKAAPDEQVAATIETRLHAKARQAGSPTAALLLDRSLRELQANDPVSATADLDAALLLDPAYVEAMNVRAAARLLNGDARGAVADCGAALKLDGRAFSALQTLSRALEAANDWPGALMAWQQSLALDPKTHDAQARLQVLRRRAVGENI